MCGHLSSVKQVRFQPGNDKVIATSSRDGSVRLWDLRCRGGMRPVHQTQVSFDPDAGQKDSVPKWISAGVYNVIPAAHAERQWLPASLTALNSAASQRYAPIRNTGTSFCLWLQFIEKRVHRTSRRRVCYGNLLHASRTRASATYGLGGLDLREALGYPRKTHSKRRRRSYFDYKTARVPRYIPAIRHKFAGPEWRRHASVRSKQGQHNLRIFYKPSGPWARPRVDQLCFPVA